MTKKILNVLILAGGLCVAVFAEYPAPVVDYTEDVPHPGVMRPISRGEQASVSAPTYRPVASSANLGSEQRISRLENQVNNINSQHLNYKFEELHQQIQSLNGQVEAQAHQIEQLSIQLKGFYQDLNQRLESGSQQTITPKTSAAPGTLDSNIIPATSANVADMFSGGGTKKNEETFLKEQKLYQEAIDLLPDKKYGASESKLRQYTKIYPDGVYAANAHYWLGEINFLQKHFDAAEEEFKIVVDKYSKSKKVSDAMLKLALVHQNQGRESQSKRELRKVIKNYPGTSAAQLAKQQLAGI